MAQLVGRHRLDLCIRVVAEECLREQNLSAGAEPDEQGVRATAGLSYQQLGDRNRRNADALRQRRKSAL